MSSGRLSVVSKETNTPKCNLGETIIIKGDGIKTGVFNNWNYRIVLGSAIGETTLCEKISGSDLKKGFEHKLKADLYEHAYPYGDGRSCYIKAIGTKDGDVVEYTAYISIKGNLLPEFDLITEIINKKFPDFGTNAVKGFSKVTAKIIPHEEIIGETNITETAAAQFSGGVFSKTFSGAKDEYVIEKNPIDTAGEVYVFANVATTFGYQASKNTKIDVLNYFKPKMSFSVMPVRYDETTDEDIKKVTSGNKNMKFPIRFSGAVAPCRMLDKDGTQLCKITEIKEKAIIKRIDGSSAEIELTVSELNKDGSRSFEYSGKPNFGEFLGEGLEVYSAYNLEITCTDSTGKDYTMVKRISTLGTAFHLGKGGNKASFGKYAEKEKTVDSAWDIHSDENISADKNIGGKTLSTKEGIRFDSDEDIEPDETLYYGVGKGDSNFAKGSHTHGYITADGRFFDEAGNPLANMILITDDEGRIIGTEILSTEQLQMAKEENSIHAVLGMKPSAGTGSIGTPEAGMCYANHIHPYSTLWKEDPDYIALKEEVSSLYSLARTL